VAARGDDEYGERRSSKLHLLAVVVVGPESARLVGFGAKVVTLTGLAIFGGVRARIAFVYGVFPKVAIRLIFKGGQPCLTIFGSVV
jgi:hypothetical protein